MYTQASHLRGFDFRWYFDVEDQEKFDIIVDIANSSITSIDKVDRELTDFRGFFSIVNTLLTRRALKT